MPLNQEQIEQLAPDAASVKAGKKQAQLSKWPDLGRNDKALWGSCQGSGKNPYRTMVDLKNMAFKCTCPSRKFPCKHALGLLMLSVSQPDAFKEPKELPEEVNEWIQKRESRAEAQSKPKKDKVVDEKARQKRIQQREQKVKAGLEDLQLWLRETVRSGVNQVPQQAYEFSEKIAARMVDAQATALANRLRALAELNYYQDGWAKDLLRELAQMYLLSDAYLRKESLPESWQWELKDLVGWNTPKEEILARPGVKDDWLLIAKTTREVDNLRMERLWLYGVKQQQMALILNFYAHQQMPSHIFIPGGIYASELAFYPSLSPLRAIFKQDPEAQMPSSLPSWEGISLAELPGKISDSLALNPFRTSLPFILKQVTLRIEEQQWYLEQGGLGQALSSKQDQLWKLLALSRGEAFDAF
ncbi:MAG: SWIM zinc finger family protein, partial [Bacteroidota bacterium]